MRPSYRFRLNFLLSEDFKIQILLILFCMTILLTCAAAIGILHLSVSGAARDSRSARRRARNARFSFSLTFCAFLQRHWQPPAQFASRSRPAGFCSGRIVGSAASCEFRK